MKKFTAYMAKLSRHFHPPRAEGAQEDVIGVYPRDVYVPVLEGRRALWTARACMIGMCSSLCVNVALSLALASLAPLKRVEPMLLTLHEKSDQVVEIEPFHKNMRGFELLVEQAVRRYVLDRETITIHPREMEFRWSLGGAIEARTSPEAFLIFQKQVPEYRNAFAQGISRDITVTAVAAVAPNYWRVEFTSKDTDTRSNTEIGRSFWQASLLIDFLPKYVRYEDRFMNPLGFTVLKYSIVKKEEAKQ